MKATVYDDDQNKRDSLRFQATNGGSEGSESMAPTLWATVIALSLLGLCGVMFALVLGGLGLVHLAYSGHSWPLLGLPILIVVAALILFGASQLFTRLRPPV